MATPTETVIDINLKGVHNISIEGSFTEASFTSKAAFQAALDIIGERIATQLELTDK